MLGRVRSGATLIKAFYDAYYEYRYFRIFVWVSIILSTIISIAAFTTLYLDTKEAERIANLPVREVETHIMHDTTGLTDDMYILTVDKDTILKIDTVKFY